jgi:hypothetical protein
MMRNLLTPERGSLFSSKDDSNSVFGEFFAVFAKNMTNTENPFALEGMYLILIKLEDSGCSLYPTLS